jgi:hypothetical protein
MAIRIKTLRIDDLSHQIGEGIPNHVSPIGSQFTNALNGDIYYNRNGAGVWELSVSHITNDNYKKITDQPDKYGKGGDNFFVTGGTLENGTLTVTRNDGTKFSVDGFNSENVGNIVINDVNKEIPIGHINGINNEFILSNTPKPGSEYVFLNGVLQEVGVNGRYILMGNKIIFNTPPESHSGLITSYQSEIEVETKIRVDREVPIRLNNSSNEFSLVNELIPGSENVFLNGVLQEYGAEWAYVITDGKIKFNKEIDENSYVIVSYNYIS